MCAAGSVRWNLDADGTWANAANWNPNTVPNGATDVALFGTNITANRTISINNSNTMTIAEAVFGATPALRGVSGAHLNSSTPPATGGTRTTQLGFSLVPS